VKYEKAENIPSATGRAGRFLVFEGIDGSGKSTYSAMLAQKLKSAGGAPDGGLPPPATVYLTKEPTDGIFGALIHQFMIGRLDCDNKTVAALFLTDRLDHLTNGVNGIKKMVDDGVTVISDRYYFSSYAYHSVYVDMDWVIDANRLCAALLKPDLHIFIDTAPETCIERIEKGRTIIEKYEKLDNLKAVRENYFRAFSKLRASETTAIIDGNAPPASVFAQVWAAVERVLPVF
jgi:dTMP kinase